MTAVIVCNFFVKQQDLEYVVLLEKLLIVDAMLQIIIQYAHVNKLQSINI